MFYLHFMDGGRVHRGSIVVITETEESPVIEHNIGGSVLGSYDGKPEIYDAGWKLGPLENKNVARQYAYAIASVGNYDVMIDGELTGLPYAPAVELGRKGGRSTSEAKRRASQANGRKGGRPKKV